MTPNQFESFAALDAIPRVDAKFFGRIPGLNVSAEKAEAEMTVSGNFNTPLAKWTEDTLTALKPCWQDQFPG